MKNLVIGGTGTLGRLLVSELLARKERVAVFSRDELKQAEMRREFPTVRFFLGDIRDERRVREVLAGGFSTVFHVAALKQVDTLENQPKEAIKTNILGTMNVADSCLAEKVAYCVFCSTDKAVLPVNTYGHTKAVAEKLLYDLNVYKSERTRFSVFRWGNVLGSRGSVIPVFVDQLKRGKVTITDPRMTRFWIPAQDAARFMLDQYKTAPMDRACIPPMKSAEVVRLVKVLAGILGVKKFELEITGIRPGEKIHECLETSHDRCLRSDNSERFTDAELEFLLSTYLEGRGGVAA